MIKLLPTINAIFNGLSFVFLLFGFLSIKKRDVQRHKKFMISAFISSTFFIIGYLIYHYNAGVTRFQGVGIWRFIYFSILSSHTFFAIFALPMAIITLSYALFKKFDKHPKVARLTLPIWMYVSVTGVLIYIMLYHIFK
ncbi:putative membrane protein [Candidatus Kryptobacter tengchongensis]|uniref:Putative membrane protein n=1 Tax=Kryptobacter tengchongensis TaxID=1643429 RepID=A0A656D216_KRYT1|nr:DUF420 domain-containing protein [Candidatus Kryptobacter tengchongensis]CUS95905.1 putative membrane protein [Candidatus Kryptobacter tengchongensis]CUU02207.1 putative membrane protein [Candidatus Kryptobacter tengchongensis]